ncbi:MAG: 4-alpha-glucanotransferase, partial [Oscillospiraceae bacterium]|nr:4-alpha-glucanotransferase [Oscillospiraceae bacterium]
VYTGTHDNETLLGWLDSIPAAARQLVRDYLCDSFTPKEELNWPLIALVKRSCARICVIPMQDYLGLDNSGRMNKPSTVGTNWLWRLERGALTQGLQETLRKLAVRYGRAEPLPEAAPCIALEEVQAEQ